VSVAAIGEPQQIAGYGLAGVALFPASDPAGVLAAWATLPNDTGLVILSRSAAAVLASRLVERDVVWVEVPE
jgi:vacuolar-type H+-ATPase subunit F/Vma7